MEKSKGDFQSRQISLLSSLPVESICSFTAGSAVSNQQYLNVDTFRMHEFLSRGQWQTVTIEL